jgi:hypothetical protein
VIDVLDAYDFLDKNPEISAINQNVIQKQLKKSTVNTIDRFYKINRTRILDLKSSIYQNYSKL